MNNGSARSDIALWRRVLSTLLLASFLWISYVAQTHIHGNPGPVEASAIVKSVHLSGKSPTKAPSNNRSDDSTDCPLCQAVNLCGALIIALLLVVLVPWLVVQVALRRALERITASYFDCGHQTRAPPIL
jgi:hypothetical protein